MQRHEGPKRDRAGEERSRQRILTRRLLGVIAVLAVAVGAALGYRLL